MQAVRNVNLYRMVLQLANHGGGVIKFKSGLKATCYTSAYWYKINRPSADWNRRLIDGVSMAGGAVLNRYKEQLPRLGALGSYIGWIGAGLFLIDISNDMQYTQINRCIDSAGSIGWIGWEKPAYSAVMPTAWNSKMFTPTEWFGEIDSVEFFD